MNTATPSSTPGGGSAPGAGTETGDSVPAPGSGSGPGAATATSAPGREPTERDRQLLRSAMAIELAARDLFRLAVAQKHGGAQATDTTTAGSGPAAQTPPDILQVAAGNHDQYADVIGGVLGESQHGARDETVYSRWESDFRSGDETTVGQAAYDLESAIVATYEQMIGQLQGLDGIERIASMVTVEAAQSTVFADLAGRGDDLDAMLENTAQPLSLTGNGETTS